MARLGVVLLPGYQARTVGNTPKNGLFSVLLETARCQQGGGHMLEAVESQGNRPATLADVHVLAESMPHVARVEGTQENPVYQVGGKSFVFFRTPRPDAVDPETGERYHDVIMFWVESEADKQSLVDDPDSPFFTTPHFNGHNSVLIRARDLNEVTYAELKEIVQDAWLARASPARARAWLQSRTTR